MVAPIRWDFYKPTPVEETEKDVLREAFNMYLLPFTYPSGMRAAMRAEAYQHNPENGRPYLLLEGVMRALLSETT